MASAAPVAHTAVCSQACLAPAARVANSVGAPNAAAATRTMSTTLGQVKVPGAIPPLASATIPAATAQPAPHATTEGTCIVLLLLAYCGAYWGRRHNLTLS